MKSRGPLAWIVRSGVVLGLAIYGVVLAEAFLQIAAPQPLFPRYITGAPYGIRANIPNAEYRHSTAEVNVGFRINGQGMRSDRDFPEAKPENVCRILMLGDSFFMGYELDLPDTIAARIEKAMKADGYNVEVLNLAVSGFGTAESMRTYEDKGRKFSPDLVLLEWDRSDFDDNVRSGLFRMVDGKLTEVSRTYLPSVALQDRLNEYAVYRALANHSQLYGLVREQIGVTVRRLSVNIPYVVNGWRQALGIGKPGPAAPPPDPEEAKNAKDLTNPKRGINETAITLSAALLKRFQEEASADNVGFVIFEMPYSTSRTNFVSTLQALPPDVLASLPIVSPVDAVRAAARPDLKLFYERGNGHLTPRGVEVTTDKLLPRLKQDPHLARCRSNGPVANGA